MHHLTPKKMLAVRRGVSGGGGCYVVGIALSIVLFTICLWGWQQGHPGAGSVLKAEMIWVLMADDTAGLTIGTAGRW